MPNRLANCQSLYLRQHADNPVDWHPWDDEAWETARRLNRPVFLSVGYSTCHWCHVMAHECFEDDEVADALNRNFVSIKLDREERPDLDEAYMSAVQIASGRGGWPMTLFLTPDCEPFFAGTYFPKHSVQGHPGFLQIVNGLATAWAEERENVLESAKRFGSALRQVRQRSIPAESVSVALVDRAVQDLHEQFDHVNGGFGSEPKFPPYTVLSFLLDFARLRPGLADPDGTGEVLAQQATHMALETLAAMARGGIRDHIGGGFHRYSTDSEWHVPHFEKMLYDNALLLGVYGRVRDRHAMFGDVCDHLVKWLESEMVTSEGVLAAALDADSDGSEGSYYVWDHQEALALVGSETLARYGFKPGGNFNDEATDVPSRLNILHLSENEVRDPALDRLATARETRPKPAKDDKGLAAWNGLAISGLVKAGHVELAAERARPWANLLPDIPHIYAADSRQSGFLDDFCAMGIAFQDLAEATHDDIWADAAETVCNEVERRFGDGSGGFNFAQTGVSNPFGDGRQHMDNPTPAANGLVVRLLRNAGLADRSKTALAQVAGWAEHMSSGCATILSECLHHLVESGGDADLKAPGPPQITLEILPAELSVAEDGFAAATLVIHLPKGHHMPTFQPAASWLVPTQMEVEGAFAEAGFPDPDGDWYEDLVEVTMRIKPLSTGGSPVTVKVTAQLCSETTCFAPQTVSATATLST